MSILKAKSKREACKFVGAFLPLPIYSYMVLYTLAQRISKSILQRKLMEDWAKKTKTEVPDQDLIRNIVLQICKRWKEEKTLNPNMDKPLYKTNLKRELFSKGLQTKYVDEILNAFENEAN